MGDNIVVLITAANAGEGQRLADTLLRERKAACVSIIPGVTSLFPSGS